MNADRRKYLIGALLLVALVLAASVFTRADEDTPVSAKQSSMPHQAVAADQSARRVAVALKPNSPNDQTPSIEQRYPAPHALDRSAESTEARAASELANYATTCWRLRLANPSAASALLGQSTIGLSEQALQALLEGFDEMEAFMAMVSANKDLCESFGNYLVENRGDLLLASARLGDLNSARCFLEFVTHFYDSESAVGNLDEYRAATQEFTQQGLQRGDWSVVRQMWSASVGNYIHGRLVPNAVVAPAPALAYRYAKLMELGDPGVDGIFPHEAMVAYATQFPVDSVAAGDEWAHDMFQRYFSRSRLNKADQICR